MLFTSNKTRGLINRGGFDMAFSRLYANAPVRSARIRYIEAIAEFERLYGPEREITLVSAPGRTEIGGNHTDHQRGRVLAAAVDLDIICVASKNNLDTIRITSKGYRSEEIGLAAREPAANETGKPASLIRGVASWFKDNGYKAGGFDAYLTSDVPEGSGLSSSAAFEVAISSIFSILYNDGAVPPLMLAIASQYAENVYFGKPSGLMDQIASAFGGFIHIDFSDPGAPAVIPVSLDLSAAGYTLCVVDTGGNHAGLIPAYAAIPAEMLAVASMFGKKYLSEVDEDVFLGNIRQARVCAGDRAVLRAMHFFSENKRVEQQAAALNDGDLDQFLRLVIESGESSFTCLQNIYVSSENQDLSIALALSKRILYGRGGAWRIHGGGFAGAIQAFVPDKLTPGYREALERVFGAGCCRALSIRPAGGVELWLN